MLEGTQVAFVGSGIMAEAMIKGMLSRALVSPGQITAAGPRPERGAELKERYAVRPTCDNQEAVRGAGLVILSVKPQVLPRVLEQLNGQLRKDSLVLSIVAGTSVAAISQGLNHSYVVRAMPNTPAQIGQGMTVWTSSSETAAQQREQAQAVLQALGQEVYVEDEDYLDMATALSGTGPAYVFLLMEAMVDAGVHLGFPRYLSESLVLQTVKGSAEYALQTPQHLARLRNQVTSPGGTSAEALYYLEKAGVRTALSRAIWAAYQRSVQLGRGKKRSELAEE